MESLPNAKIDSADKNSGDKVVADVAEHRRGTEAHVGVYRLRESGGVFVADGAGTARIAGIPLHLEVMETF